MVEVCCGGGGGFHHGFAVVACFLRFVLVSVARGFGFVHGDDGGGRWFLGFICVLAHGGFATWFLGHGGFVVMVGLLLCSWLV